MDTKQEALSWNDLADLHDKAKGVGRFGGGGRPARTLPMDTVWDWAVRQEDKFYVCPEEGTIHQIEPTND